ncbi:hypothetical protein B0A50_08782 [Salinomyces thailandicus]|uniref:Tcp11-domain-containing protein n=1 Tax=Salinomyces thailandicus TaxID=706561 RepID=A0A4U0TJL9_9PEZI|nr:hypothetical protein B0A50_08782 [Salinomyces thailandica]
MTDPSSPTDHAQIYAPPAHLAARFYRGRSNARRKSSAASSRRNSLSSAHSHASSRRSHSIGGCQSHYIAQHLRRASIIESRKARLADRAAHAEQVRLRAALAKAAPRSSDGRSEERALAAQVAKEKYLAKVAAACAEEVSRAKRIAEEVKERKLAEETRQRLEMEERHAEAERRRQEYQRNLQARRARRAESADNPKKLAVVDEISDDVFSEEAVLDEEAEDAATLLDVESAGRRIQRAWRVSRRRGVVSDFTKLNLNTSTKATFDEMTALLARGNVVASATVLLTQLGLQTPSDDNAALNTRTFLSAFLMVAHPVAVLTNANGAQEQDVLSKAGDLLANFEHTISRLADWNNWTPSATQRETLSQSYSSYTSAFAAWRLQDSSVLIEGMVASFVELDAIWQTVKDDSRGEVASDYAQGIRDNQVMLLSRIRKLAGADRADFLIKKAIRESRRRRPKKRNVAEVRPRGVESEGPVAETAQSVVDPPTALNDTEEVRPQQMSESTADVTRRLFTPMPGNRVLTHELAIDKDYRLSDSAETAALRADLYRSICSAMRQGFEEGSGGLWTLSAAENVREKLLRMLKPGNSMHTLISDTLDLDSVRRQCQAGVFSYEGFFEFMANILPKLCAPFRDTEMAALAAHLQQPVPSGQEEQLEAMTDKLFKVLRAVDSLSLDYSNFMVMNAAPTLVREAAGYEARAFAADLQNGSITLDNTKRWWKASVDQLNAEADRRDPEGLRLDRPVPAQVYTHGLVALALNQQGSSLDSEMWPETLHLDAERLRGLRQQAIRITVIGAILLTAKNLLKRDVRAQWKQQASRLWSLLAQEPYTALTEPTTDGPSPAEKAFSILETANNIPPATKTQIQNTITRFFTQASSITTTRLTDPVLKVLYQRLRTHVLQRLSASTSSERVRAASSASEALTSCGLGEVTAQVGAVVEVLERVRRVDWEAHGGWYEGVAAAAAAAVEGEEGGQVVTEG